MDVTLFMKNNYFWAMTSPIFILWKEINQYMSSPQIIIINKYIK